MGAMGWTLVNIDVRKAWSFGWLRFKTRCTQEHFGEVVLVSERTGVLQVCLYVCTLFVSIIWLKFAVNITSCVLVDDTAKLPIRVQ